MTDQGTPQPAPEPAEGVGTEAPRRTAWAIYGGLVVLLVAAAAVLLVVVVRDDSSQAGEYRVVIPMGTGEQIDAGEPVELIPAELDLDLYTSFVVENHDERLHEVGPFSVRPGETLSYQFTQAGTYKGTCTVHPSGDVTIVVT
jgi:hypothetical protein